MEFELLGKFRITLHQSVYSNKELMGLFDDKLKNEAGFDIRDINFNPEGGKVSIIIDTTQKDSKEELNKFYELFYSFIHSREVMELVFTKMGAYDHSMLYSYDLLNMVNLQVLFNATYISATSVNDTLLINL